MPSPHDLIDTHSHIAAKRFADDVDAVMARAREAGVVTVVVPATEPSEFERIRSLKESYGEIEIALGVHPHSAATVDDAAIEKLPEELSGSGAVAVGEIGLDYFYDFAPRDRQIEVFRRQIAIARELDLPIVIHNRESDDDVLSILGEEQDGSLRFQLHCFSSGPDVLRRAVDLGGMISFTGNITFAKSTLDEVVALVPPDRLMIETDAPFMTPVPHRGQRNEPVYVREVAERIAAIRNETFTTIAQMTTTNARRFFNLLSILLLTAGGLAIDAVQLAAQPPIEPVVTIDTVPKEPFDKLLGFGPHLTGTTFIIDHQTLASAFNPGFFISTTPLQPLGIDFLSVDMVYTPARVPTGFGREDGAIVDSSGREFTDLVNEHTTLDLFLRFNWKPSSFIDISLSGGYTHFTNMFDNYRILVEELGDTTFVKTFRESKPGLGGGLGVSMNIPTSFGHIMPMAQYTFSSMLGDRGDLIRQGELFQISQIRIGVFYFPPFSKLLGLPNE